MRVTTILAFALALFCLSGPSASAGRASNASLRGQIYADRLGLPFPDAKVEVYDGDKLVATAISNGQGFYRISELRPGKYVVVCLLPATIMKRIEIELNQNEELLLNIGLKLGNIGGAHQSTLFLSGSVKDLRQEAITDAVITVVNPLDQQVIGRAISNAQGKFKVRVDYGDQFIVTASKPGFTASCMNVYPDINAPLVLSPLQLRR
jgi:hypothetical protein